MKILSIFQEEIGEARGRERKRISITAVMPFDNRQPHNCLHLKFSFQENTVCCYLLRQSHIACGYYSSSCLCERIVVWRYELNMPINTIAQVSGRSKTINYLSDLAWRISNPGRLRSVIITLILPSKISDRTLPRGCER